MLISLSLITFSANKKSQSIISTPGTLSPPFYRELRDAANCGCRFILYYVYMPFPSVINRSLDYRRRVDALFDDIGQLR